MKKKKEKEVKPGDVLGIVSPEILDKFKQSNRLRNEASSLLIQCSKLDEGTWESIKKDFNMSDEFHYSVNATGKLTVGNRR